MTQKYHCQLKFKIFDVEKKRVIVDCDPGIDDALAIKYLLERIHLLFFLIFEIDKEFCFVEHQE